MKEISRREVELDDGSRIVALDEPEPTDPEQYLAYSNNVFRYAPDGSVTWQIDAGKGVGGVAPFTGLEIRDGELLGYRWDGGLYAIDVASGKTRYLYLAK